MWETVKADNWPLMIILWSRDQTTGIQHIFWWYKGGKEHHSTSKRDHPQDGGVIREGVTAGTRKNGAEIFSFSDLPQPLWRREQVTRNCFGLLRGRRKKKSSLNLLHFTKDDFSGIALALTRTATQGFSTDDWMMHGQVPPLNARTVLVSYSVWDARLFIFFLSRAAVTLVLSCRLNSVWKWYLSGSALHRFEKTVKQLIVL